MPAHLSFRIDQATQLSAVDSAGNARFRVQFDVFFTSGRDAQNREWHGPILLQSPPGTPRTTPQIKLTIFNAIKTEALRLDAVDAAPRPIDWVGTPTRYDATIASPTPIADADIPTPDPTPTMA